MWWAKLGYATLAVALQTLTCECETPPQPAEWMPLNDVPAGLSRAEHCAVFIPAHSLVVATGGSDVTAGGRALNSTMTFSTTLLPAGDWKESKAVLNSNRRDVGCAVLHEGGGRDIIVAVGGSRGQDSSLENLASIELLDASLPIEQWEWEVSTTAVLDPPRTGPAVTIAPDGRGLVIAGGFTGTPSTFQYLDQVLFFNGTSLHELPPLPFRRSSMGLATLIGTNAILAFGGGSQMPAYNETARFDWESQSWELLLDSPLIAGAGRNRPGVATLPGTSTNASAVDWVVAVGGFSLEPFFDPMVSVECWSSATAKWNDNNAGSQAHIANNQHRVGGACPVSTALAAPAGAVAVVAINASCVFAVGGEGSESASFSTQLLCVIE